MAYAYAYNHPSESPADIIKRKVADYFLERSGVAHFEVSVSHSLRADVMTVKMKTSEVTIVEVKSSVADFRADKKWQNYKAFCNVFYFAMTPETYEKVKDSIKDPDVGVLLVTSEARIKVRPKVRTLDPATHIGVLTKMAFRSADRNRHYHKSVYTPQVGKIVAVAAAEHLKATQPKLPSKARKELRDLIYTKIQSFT